MILRFYRTLFAWLYTGYYSGLQVLAKDLLF